MSFQNLTRITCLVCGFFFFNSGICQIVPSANTLVKNLEIGDWILRKGTTADSMIIGFVGNSRFSHIGIISSLKPEAKIIHAMTDSNGEHGSVRETTLEKFVSSDRSNIAVIIRPAFLTALQKKTVVESIRLQIGLPFILAERHEQHRYCTTLIADATSKVEPSFVPSWTYLNVPFFIGEYLFPDAFINYPNTVCVMQIQGGKYSQECK